MTTVISVQDKCPHNENNVCELASLISGKECTLLPGICGACEACTRPRRLNRYVVDLAMKYNRDIPLEKIQDVIDGTSEGFGTRLANTIGIIFADQPDCKCPGHRDILDVWTPSYIRANLDSITNWLSYEALKRGIPFSRKLCKFLLRGLLATVK